jgi:hypothetical protein
MRFINYTFCLAAILLLTLIASCSKGEQTVVCYRTPSFPVYISESNLKNTDEIYFYLVDTLSGSVVDSINLKTAFRTEKTENGSYTNSFEVNENERLFSENSAAKYYLIFTDKKGKADTIKNLTWQTTNIKNGCPIFTNMSFTSKGQVFNDFEYSTRFYILQ